MDIPKQWYWCGKKCHLVQIIKDGDVEIVVYKHWLKTRQRWNYVTEERWLVEMSIDAERTILTAKQNNTGAEEAGNG